MSLGLSVTDITNSSFSSDATADLPRICDDSDCLYPFGPACQVCSFVLDMKAGAKKRIYPVDRVDEWVEEVQVNRHIVIQAGEEFTGGADETNGILSDTTERGKEEGEEAEEGEEVEEKEEHSDADDGLSEYEFVLETSSNSVMEDDGYDTDIDIISESTLLTLHLDAPSCGMSGRSSSSWMASSPPASLVDRTKSKIRFPWLDTIFSNTLHGQMDEVHFTGGADIEQNSDVEQDPDVEICLICGKPTGEATDQHYLKCKYAHEELERWATSFETGCSKRGRVHW
ncbi:hypothetical protein ACEPPN_013851 [Leptodophora sp. 'Broadleaf-Isolate-01']